MRNKRFRLHRYFKILAAIAFFGMIMVARGQQLNSLPKTEILGKEYYIYEAKKGESVYAISKKYDWDLEELMRLNPDASNSLQKGSRLYYPTGQVAVVNEMPQPIEIDYSEMEPIEHTVKKGETVYSISRQYAVPLEIIYKYNPSSKKGVKSGEVITIPQNGSLPYYYYKTKRGDTLPGIAANYNTNVEDVLKNNPGLNGSNLKEGEIIRITINSNVGKIKTELVAEERVSQISGYKVSKDESWDDISEKTGVEVEMLKEANTGSENPSANTVINVPVVEVVEVEKNVSPESPAEMSFEEVREIYDSIKGLNPEEETLREVKIALILDEPGSKKDIDFTRGMLIGLSEFKDAPFKINFKVIDGRVSSGNLTDELDADEPNLIISTADKAFPLFLADYGNTNNVQVINVFDLKNDLYEDNASIVQLLPPSGIFYDRIATQIYKDNRRRKLVKVGEIDENDELASELTKLFDGEDISLSLEEFGAWEPELTESLLIYSYAGKKEEVADFITNVENLYETGPGLDFRVVGRSSWMALTDDFGNQFEKFNVYIPSRVWLDEEKESWKQFTEEYEKMFDGYPVRSIPNYAATGYDVARYFIPVVAENQGDFNRGLRQDDLIGLQNDIELTRVNNWGGFINNTSYLIGFRPNGFKEKIVVK